MIRAFNKKVRRQVYQVGDLVITALSEQFKIQHHNSSPYQPKMNGVVEAANKNIKKIIQKMTVTYKDWHEMLQFDLHGYRTQLEHQLGQPVSLWPMVWKLSYLSNSRFPL